ncbi:MAG: tetratricopeptide repeat protein, partial [Planctomycetota bacterium]|nr:tetratricopeptide repeat protein [Planctomycetota bacterium]
MSALSLLLKHRVAQAALGLFILVAGYLFQDFWSAHPEDVQVTFVGRSSCIQCHQKEAASYQGSHHDLAMDLATEETVLADFDDATFENDGIVSRMFRDGERFMIHTEGEDGEMRDFHVKYVFGVEPLQQYMVEFDRTDETKEDEIPRVQVLRISWDTAKKKWFYLRPPDVTDKLEPDDPLHWTGIGQRWQTMCADCHSTDLKRNFDSKTNQYHTTFSEIDVSCEACHGPGSLHVELANSNSVFWDRRHGYGLAELKGEDAEPQLQTCAPCHSRRGLLDTAFQAGDSYCDHFQLELLQEDTYFADGQIKDEVYVYGSFVQSKMYHKGIRCTDCHDPHSLKLKHPGNETCTSCHQHAAGKYDVPSHHHHVPGTEGAKCVNCHMPERTYMAVDPRRDHSLRVPRPDLSVSIGTPNACSGCHVEDQMKSLPLAKQESLKEYADWIEQAEQGDEEIAALVAKTDQWCDEACEKWYGEERKQPPHFSETIARYRAGITSSNPEEITASLKAMLKLANQSDAQTPAIARASALNELAASGTPNAFPAAVSILKKSSESPLVRAAAIKLFMMAPPSITRKALMPLLTDEVRLLRNEAARVLVASGTYQNLSDSEKTRVSLALRDVKASLMAASDRAGAHLGWAMLCEGQGRFKEAIEAYQTAIRVEPNTTGPRSNLSSLLENLASQRSGKEAADLITQADQLRRNELPLLERDANLAPENASVQYRFGLALYLAGRMNEALQRLETAAALQPDVPDFTRARDLLKQKIIET